MSVCLSVPLLFLSSYYSHSQMSQVKRDSSVRKRTLVSDFAIFSQKLSKIIAQKRVSFGLSHSLLMDLGHLPLTFRSPFRSPSAPLPLFVDTFMDNLCGHFFVETVCGHFSVDFFSSFLPSTLPPPSPPSVFILQRHPQKKLHSVRKNSTWW